MQKHPNILILPNNMAFHTEKDLKSKNVKKEKKYILAKDVNTEKNLNQSQKNRPEKSLFLVLPNSGS